MKATHGGNKQRIDKIAKANAHKGDPGNTRRGTGGSKNTVPHRGERGKRGSV